MRRLILAVILAGAAAAGAQTFRVNCGGNAVNDAFGRPWLADEPYAAGLGYGYVGGSEDSGSWGSRMGGTRENGLLRPRHNGMTEYRFDVANGTYGVNMRWAEIYLHGPDFRRFSVSIEGTVVEPGLDVAAEVGKDYAMERRYLVTVADNQLNITFGANLSAPMVSAISVAPIGPDAQGPGTPVTPGAMGIFGACMVTWWPGSEDDLDGYDVFRASSLGGPYTQLNATPIQKRRFIDDTVSEGPTYYYQVRGVDLWGNPGPFTSPFAANARSDSASNLPIANVIISAGALHTLNANVYSDVPVLGGFEWRTLADPATELRYRGNIARRFPKKSWNVNIGTFTVSGRDKLNLKASFQDATWLREPVSYSLLRDGGCVYATVDFVHLHVNGEEAGLYQDIEQVDEVFLARHRLNPDSDLYKAAEGGNMYPRALAQYPGRYDRKTGDRNDYTELDAFIRLLDTTPAPSLPYVLADSVDINAYFAYYSGIILASDLDFTGHNYYLYRQGETHQWTMLPWDQDLNFIRDNVVLNAGAVGAPPNPVWGTNLMVTRMLEVPILQTIYLGMIQERLATDFTAQEVYNRAVAVQGAILSEARADIWSPDFEGTSNIENGPNDLRNFMNRRIPFVVNQLAAWPGTPAQPVVINEVLARNSVTVADEVGEYEDYVELYNRGAIWVDLSGMYLTDEPLVRMKWMIPPGTGLSPGDHLLIWCDNEPLDGPLHATFRLDGDGEKLALYSAAGAGTQLLDVAAVDSQYPDTSYGRRASGSFIWGFQPPSPGAANTFQNNRPPTIWDVRRDPLVPLPMDPVTVHAMVEDELGQGSVSEARLFWDTGQGVLDQPMLDDGQSGDGLPQDRRYGATLPGQPQGTIVRYWIRATDGVGLALTEPDNAPADTLIYIVGSGGGPLFINEFCADNQGVIQDAAGDFDDWVEIYNGGAVTVDLSGMFLTDNLTDTTRWAFPAGTSLAPGDFLLVWTDGEPAEGPLHATFRLSANGEEIGLFDSLAAGNGLLDAVIFGPQATDVSRGRSPDAGSVWRDYRPPTPGAPNTYCRAPFCGDCDLDGSITILDSLAAAQHGVGLITLLGTPFFNCDVDRSLQVNILDGLVLGRLVAGLPAALACC